MLPLIELKENVTGTAFANQHCHTNNNIKMNIFKLSAVLDRIAIPNDKYTRKALAAGLAVRFFRKSWDTRDFTDKLANLLCALETSQYDFYFDSLGRNIGFLTWALVNPETSLALMTKGAAVMGQYDRNSGSDLWIIDFFALDKSVRDIIADLRDATFPDYQYLTYFRYKHGRRLVKQISREDQTSFFAPKDKQHFLHQSKRELATLDGTSHAIESSFFRAIQVGQCIFALKNSNTYRYAALWRSLYRLHEIVAINQFKIYRSASNEASGLLTWAWLSRRTVSNLSRTPLHATHTSEWNEGDMLCFCDAALSDSIYENLVADIQENLFPLERVIYLYIPPNEKSPGHLICIERDRQSDAIRSWLSQASNNFTN